MVGFPVGPSGSLSWSDVMPPNAPVGRAANGDVLGVPPVLEDMEIELTAKGAADLRGQGGDVLKIFQSLRRE